MFVKKNWEMSPKNSPFGSYVSLFFGGLDDFSVEPLDSEQTLQVKPHNYPDPRPHYDQTIQILGGHRSEYQDLR